MRPARDTLGQMGVPKAQFPRLNVRLPPAGRTFDVIGVGENSMDTLVTVPHWPAADEKVELLSFANRPGGQVATALVGCARLGCRTQYLGVFGDDEHGRSVERALRSEGVNTHACVTAHAPNRTAFIVIDPSAGTRTVLWIRDPALQWPNPSLFAARIRQSRSLLVDTTDLAASIAAATAAKQAGVPVMLDIDASSPGVEPLLESVDVVITSEGFPRSHTGARNLGEAMRQLKDTYRPSAVVVTLGARGAVCWNGEAVIRSPGFVVPVVDPTGAGDAFRAGFLAAWLSGTSSIRDLLDFGNATAALKCRAAGAQAGLPTRAEVLGLLTDANAPRSNQAGSETEVGHP